MGLFRRNKKEDVDSDREVKDLSTKNKRKRKEPVKSWGKKERIFVFVVFFGMALASAFLAMSSRNWKLPGYPKLSVGLPSFQRKYVLELERSADFDSSSVIHEFRANTRDLTGVYGFAVVRLNEGVSYGYLQDDTFQAASLMKLPVMALAFQADEEGEGIFSKTYRLIAQDKVGGSGSLQNADIGTIFTFGELIEKMGKESDNTAYKVVLRELGETRVQDFINEIGMRQTSLDDNTTTPADIAKFFKKLWTGKIVSVDGRDQILEYLTSTIYEEHLPAGLPAQVVIAHKYGREANVINDAGIVYADDPFVLVIMSDGVKEDEGDLIIPELAGVIYEFEVKN